MKKIYEIGPFRTKYHRDQVNDEFICLLNKYLNENIFPHLNLNAKVTISLQTKFDEERFLGPNSICKDRYDLFVEAVDGSSKETARMTFNYKPNERRFNPLHNGPHIDNLFAQKQRTEDSKHLIDIQSRVKKGQTEIPCPRCNSILDLSIAKKKKGPVASWIICKENKCFRVHVNLGSSYA